MTSSVRPGPRTQYRWLVLGIMFLLYTFAFADRANIGVVLPHIRDEFRLSNGQVGLIAALFSISYALCQVPAAMLVRRFGVRRTVPVFMTLTSLIAATGGLASSAFALQVSRVALGIVEAPLALSMATTLNNWFAPTEKGTAAGIFSAATKFAPVIVPPIGALIIAVYGWREVFFVFALPGVLLAVLWAVLVADRPADSRFVSVEEAAHIERSVAPAKGAGDRPSAGRDRFALLDRLLRARTVTPLDGVRDIFSSWTIWGLALCYMFLQGVVGVILFLLPLYLTDVKHFSILNVGLVSAAPFAGAVVGNLLGGVVSDRVFGARRKPMMLVTFAATVATMWILRAAPNAVLPLAALLFVTGILLTVGYSSYAVYASPMTTRAGFPVSSSLVNTLGQAGTALAPLAVGFALDRYGWTVVFGALSLCSLTGLAILLTIMEPRPGEPDVSSPNANAVAS